MKFAAKSGSGKLLCLSVLFLSIFISCQTMQSDIMTSTSSEISSAAVSELETAIVSLDTNASADSIRFLRQRVRELERDNVQDSHYKAQLAAWSGRLYLIEGNTNEAKKALENSERLFPGNIQSLVLSARLESDPEKRLNHINEALNAEPASGELSIEKARALFDLKRYSESAAAFDTAFNQFNQHRADAAALYEEVYQPFRTQAWDLRNVSSDTSETSAVIIQKTVITWADVINLTSRETTLLNFLTAGRTWQVNDLFSRLVDQGFIPRTQDASIVEWPNLKAAPSDTVFRSGAAWFLWHLYAEYRADARLLTRFSARWNARLESPILDISVSSPFFDSILGSVEQEFMSLPDGLNFNPEETVSGTAFYTMLNRVSGQ